MSSMTILENPNISLEVDPSGPRMIFKRVVTGIELHSPIPTLSYIESGRPKVLTLMQSGDKGTVEPQQAPLDRYRTIRWEKHVEGFGVALEWAIHESSPHILWCWSMSNYHEQPIILNRASMLACANASYLNRTIRDDMFRKMPGEALPRDQMSLSHPGIPSTLAVYLPGWQSWSYGGWLMAEDHFPHSRLGPLTFPIIYDRAQNLPRARGHFRSEMFAGFVDTQTHASLSVGYLSQAQSFGTVELCIDDEARALSVWTDLDKLQLDPGDSFSSDWACLMLNDNGMEIVDEFAALAGELNQARIPAKAAVGWCSWYGYGQAISEVEIRANVDEAGLSQDQIPMNVIQIDDGFQAEIGDWLSVSPQFSSGMRPLADDIKGAGYAAGLWLAPFIALSRSNTARHHPEWILRDKWGFPSNTGWVWNQFGRAIDLTHPGFLDYLQEVISSATGDWGYEYLKLDFLYAGVLQGVRHNPRLTRAQAFHHALRLIRETAGESVTLVGCGCPLGPGIGIFDSMRIGPDVAATWKPSFPTVTPLLRREPTLPAAVNAIRNTINRALFHRRWWINDPDCLLVRDLNSDLNLGEIQSLATAIGMSGGSLMLSDRLESLSSERLELFGLLIPPLPGRMRLLSAKDSHDHPVAMLEIRAAAGTWWLIAAFNTGDTLHRSTLVLDDNLLFSGYAHVFDVWHETYIRHDISKPLNFDTEAHQVSLLAIRQMKPSPAWIGDKVHLSQGLIVDEWQPGKESLQVRIKTYRKCDARFWIYLPGEMRSATYNQAPVEPELINGLSLFQLNSIEDGILELRWSEAKDDH